MASLAEALPQQIDRVQKKKERWQGYMRDMDMGPGLQFSINIMDATIREGVEALASGDVVRMMAAHQALADYNDDD